MATEFVTATKTSEIPVSGVTAIDVRGTRIAVANQRVEDLAPDVAGTFDAVVSRAALQPSDLFAAGKRLLRAGGLLVAYRGAAQDRPGSSAEPAAALWTAEPSIAYRIPGSAMEFRLDAWRLGAA